MPIQTDPRQLTLPLFAVETLDVTTAARLARVSPETMRRWCECRIVPAFKLVGRWRLLRREFHAWLEQHSVNLQKNLL